MIDKEKHQNDNSQAKPGIVNDMLPRECSLKFEQ